MFLALKYLIIFKKWVKKSMLLQYFLNLFYEYVIF